MIKLTVSLAAALAFNALLVSPSEAEPVPQRATGIWSEAECGSRGLSVLVNRNAALMIESREHETTVAIARAEWVSGAVIVMLRGQADELVLPPLDSLERCDALPTAFSLLFAEAVTAFGQFDDVTAHCTGPDVVATLCVALVFDMIDVSDDGVFSKAELSRTIRAASFFIGYSIAVEESQTAFVTLDKLSVAPVVASVFAPFVATHLIDSYDFDGDGFLSLKELLQDRSPEEGLHGVAAGLATKAPPAMTTDLINSAKGLLDLLRR